MKKKTKKSIQWTAGIVAAGLSALLLDAFILEKFFFEVKYFDIGKTGGRKRLKLLLLSDLHFKKRLWSYHQRLATKIHALQPDLILLTGDTLDSSGQTNPLHKFLGLLPQETPKVAVPGNHDHKAHASLSTLRQVYQEHNCTLLLNESVSLAVRGTQLTISGLDDFIEGSENLAAAVTDIGQEAHHFLLIHSPLQQEPVQKEIARINQSRSPDRKLTISYIFAGHNHGGQLTLFGYAPKLPAKSGPYVKGWYNSRKPYLYVSKGFGTTTVPFRLGARSEVTLFNYFV